MASSLPEFKVYMDFNALKEAGNDTAFVDSIAYISKGLKQYIPREISIRIQETSYGRFP